jgi:hypothetical protein
MTDGVTTATTTATGTSPVPLWRMAPAERDQYWAGVEAGLEAEGAFADVDALALAAVGPRDAYVEAALARRWEEVCRLDPAAWRDRRDWEAKVGPAYRPQLEAAWEAAVRARAAGIRRERAWARHHRAAQPPPPLPMRPFAGDLITLGLWPPTGLHHWRPLFVLLPLAAPGARELMGRLGLGESDVPDFSEPYWATRLGYGGNPSRLPRGRALVLRLTLDPLGDGPNVPDAFDPATAATWTRELARRPPSEAELLARAKVERKAREDAEAAGRERDREAEKRRQEEERLRRNPLAKIAGLEAQLRDLTGRLEDAEALAQAERLRRELDELLARRRNGHG